MASLCGPTRQRQSNGRSNGELVASQNRTVMAFPIGHRRMAAVAESARLAAVVPMIEISDLI